MSKSRAFSPKLDIDREVTRAFIKRMQEAFSLWTNFVPYGNGTWGEFLVERSAVSYQERNFLSKYVDEQTLPADERRSAAIVKWLGVEQRNQRTNSRLTSSNPWFTLRKMDSKGYREQISAWDLFFKARRVIYRVLGDVPEDILLNGKFTNGASTSKRRSLDTLARKFTEKMDATPDCWTLVSTFLGEVSPLWTQSNPELLKPRIVKGNILFTVPKNAEIDRVACKEPDLNLYCQASVGRFIRERLKRVAHIDLNDQRVNQRLAQSAFKRKLATIDLSSASDSMTTGLVAALLPPSWVTLLAALRSPKTFIGEESHVNEMISSMGNGYTFELESLIFYALAKSVAMVYDEPDAPVGVYGDDIVVKQSHARLLIQLLGWSGFKVNVDKTFVEGPLFESCGEHFYQGCDVSPFFLRAPFRDVSDLILTLNQLRDWMIRTNVDMVEHIWVEEHLRPLVKLTTFTGLSTFYMIWKDFSRLVPRSLHGGWDLSLRTSLVTMGPSRCKLVPVLRSTKQVTDAYQTGMYLAHLASVVSHGDEAPTSLGKPFMDLTVYRDAKGTLEFPMRFTGEWRVRRYDNTDRFFGIVTQPLFQEGG